jgi:hypothetical protein
MKLNNPVEEIYRILEEQFGVIKIPQGDIERCAKKINAEMERFDREWKYKCAKSEEEAMHHYLNF